MRLKALYQDIRAACYYFHKYFKSTAQRDIRHAQVQAVSLAAWYLPCPQLSFNRALHTLWWQVSTKIKTKYRKEKQTDTSAQLSILNFASSLARSRAQCYTSWSHQAWVSGVIPTSQNHNNMQSAYMDVPIFLAQKNNFLFFIGYFWTLGRVIFTRFFALQLSTENEVSFHW